MPIAFAVDGTAREKRAQLRELLSVNEAEPWGLGYVLLVLFHVPYFLSTADVAEAEIPGRSPHMAADSSVTECLHGALSLQPQVAEPIS
jgi:hypothetical protein